MQTYFMLGKYSLEALKGISKDRTKKAEDIIQKNGGKLASIHATQGKYDLVLIINFPEPDMAIKTSVELTKLTNISFITIPAISVEKFDELMEDI